MEYDSLKIFRNRILYSGSAVAFVAALVLYLICVDPGASLWDCPEYITSAYRLEVGHPPGNPTWMLMANVVSHLVPDVRYVALAVNITSCLATALAVLFLFQSVFLVLLSSVFPPDSKSNLMSAGIAALTGSLVFAWCDSVIFSAVEAEVYALSLMMLALMIWLMIKWAIAYRSGENRSRYLILTGYLCGLSVGIHELNLLALTTLFLIYVFAKNRRPCALKAWLGVVVSFVVIAFILLFWMPGMISLAGKVDLYFANKMGWRVNDGAVAFIIILFVVVWSLPFLVSLLCRRKLVTIAWIFTFFVTGCSTYLLLPVRAGANPPMNQVDPSNPFSLYSYFTREQYGSKPLFYGKTPYSKPLKIEEVDSLGHASYSTLFKKKKAPKYAPFVEGATLSNRSGMLTHEDSTSNAAVMKAGNGYLTFNYKYDFLYEPELNMWFPRIFSSNPSDLSAYESWAGMSTSTMDHIPVSGAVDSIGNAIGRYPYGDSSKEREKEKQFRPTYLQQFLYLVNYQIGYMYLRYLMWNFSGRQNNVPSTGEIDHGNFITGIPPLDNLMLGNTADAPSELGKENRGHNEYFMIPFILGIFGAIGFLFFNRPAARATGVVLSLFLMTGLAIVFYINQDPIEPRERDYSFLGSFYAFSVWISFGTATLIRMVRDWSRSRLQSNMSRRIVWSLTVVACLAVPALVIANTHDDHNRSGRDSATMIASELLNSLDPDAILFVEGDNAFFPLIYAQEVLGIRRDVTIVLKSYLPAAWYVAQLQREGEKARPVAMTASQGNLLFDAFPSVRFVKGAGIKDGLETLKALYSSDVSHDFPVIRADSLSVPIGDGEMIIPLAAKQDGNSFLMRDQLALLDIIVTNLNSSNPRPVYWMNGINESMFGSFKDYNTPDLYTRKLTLSTDKEDGELALKAADDFIKRNKTGKKRSLGRVDPDMAKSMRFLRQDAIRLASRLLDAGVPEKAREVTLLAMEIYPFEKIQPVITVRDGEVYNELLNSVDILKKTENVASPSDGGRELASRLEKLQKKREKEFQEYYYSLPSGRRHAVSYESKAAAGLIKPAD